MPVPQHDPEQMRVAAIIPAKDEGERIAATVRAVSPLGTVVVRNA